MDDNSLDMVGGTARTVTPKTPTLATPRRSTRGGGNKYMYTLAAKIVGFAGNDDLRPLLRIWGSKCLTGRFPKSPTEELTRGPLELVKCNGADACGLVQLHHMYDPGEMYGEGYGYRSGLNRAMVRHLRQEGGDAAADRRATCRGYRAGYRL